MKQKYFLCTMGMAVLLFTGCGKQQSQMGYIGAETAKQTALEDASLSVQDVEAVTTEMSTRDGINYYQVSFQAAGQSYQYDIDALTGVIISTRTQNGEKTQTKQPESSDFAAAVSVQPSEAETLRVSQSSDEAYIGEEEARRIALEHAGLDKAQATFVSSALELEEGRWVYDVEFYSADYKEYDYEIDAYAGTVVSYDYDAENYRPQPSNSNAITVEQAKQLALAQVPGATDSDVRKMETDYDDGILRYEGEILYNGMEYEFEIDAYSGLIREWSAEPFAR